MKGGTPPPPVARAALAYSRRGIPVFPCEPGGKRPLTYNGFWDATTEAARVAAWWRRWPDANVGVPTGVRSGLVVLDVDSDAGGPDSLALLERLYGQPPRTAKARTGGGGVHVFFRYPADETVRKDRKSTRLNSSHANISYAVFCLKKKKKHEKFVTVYLTRDHQ